MTLNYLENLEIYTRLHEEDNSLGHIATMIGYVRGLKNLRNQLKDSLKFLNVPNQNDLLE